MSPFRLGLGVAALVALLWTIGALEPAHHGYWTSLDLRWYFFPVYEAFYGALRAGAPMIWNPYQLCGMPMLGTLQAGFFYPFHVLYLLLPTGSALAASAALHTALLAGSGAAFARRAGLSAPGATLAAMILAMTGAVPQWQVWPYLLEAFAWMPLGAIGVLDLTERRRARGALLVALATGASCLAGCPQVTVFAGYTWGGLLIARLASPAVAPRERLSVVAATAAALVAGGLLGAVTLFPAYEMAQENLRPTRSLSPAFLYPVGGPPTIRGVARTWLAIGSHGLVPALALVPFALRAGAGWLAAWAAVVGGLAGLLALGPATPAVHLYFLLPMVGWFREPSRLLSITGICVGILAGLGLDVLARHFRARAVAPAIVAAILAALTYQGLHMPRATPPLPYRQSDVPWTGVQHDAYVRLAQMIGSDRVWPFSPGVFGNSLHPKLPSLTRLRSIEDYEPLSLRRQAEFFVYLLEGSVVSRQFTAQFEGRTTTLRAPRGREPTATRRRLLDLAATRFVVMRPSMLMRPDVAAFVRDAGLEPRPALGSDLDLWENPHALPRAYVTYRARPAPPARKLLRLMARDGFDPLVESFIEADTGIDAAADAPARGAAAAIGRDEPQLVEVQATLAAPGLVVLADTFAAGWRASVDGIPAPVLATNHLFRGVPVPAGEHRVRFEYRPRALQIGAIVTLATALALCVFGWCARTRRAGW